MIATTSISTRRALNLTTAAVVLLSAMWLFTTPLRHQGNLMAYAQDDFYYYLVAARNLAAGRGSTFDGSTLTNGYHPLYFLIVWGVCQFTSQIAGVFRFLSFLDTVSAITIFLAARAILAKRVKSAWLTNGLALATLWVCYPKLEHQMEVTLTLPLLFLFLYTLDCPPEDMSARRWAGAGIMGSLMVLSRLDSVWLVFLFGVGALAEPRYRKAIQRARFLAFPAAFAPLIAGYLVINEVYFHRLMPISGAAKQLRTTRGFQWSSLLEYGDVFHILIASAIILGLVLVFRRRLAAEDRVLCGAALGFPIMHWLAVLWISDWRVWPWYSYSVRSAMLATFVLAGAFITRRFSPRMQQAAGIVVFAFFLLMAVTRRFLPNGIMQDVFVASEGIREFAMTHPGRYAMGDRGGMAGYLDGQPTIQTEGLMMDDAFLSDIKKQEPLRDVLKAYKIDYYVGFSEKTKSSWKPVEGCFEAREPAQAGLSSPTLKGEFCEKPAWKLIQKTGETMIFDLRSEQQGPVTGAAGLAGQ